MNLYQQLLVVRERLEGIGAHDDTMELVEKLLSKSEAAREAAILICGSVSMPTIAG